MSDDDELEELRASQNAAPNSDSDFPISSEVIIPQQGKIISFSQKTAHPTKDKVTLFEKLKSFQEEIKNSDTNVFDTKYLELGIDLQFWLEGDIAEQISARRILEDIKIQFKKSNREFVKWEKTIEYMYAKNKKTVKIEKNKNQKHLTVDDIEPGTPLHVDKEGRWLPTPENVISGLKSLGWRIRFNLNADQVDMFHLIYKVAPYDPLNPIISGTKHVSIVNDIESGMSQIVPVAQNELHKHFNFVKTPERATINEAIDRMANDDKYDPKIDTLLACKDYYLMMREKEDDLWRDRLETFFIDNIGDDDNALQRTIARCWIMAVTARGLYPGCKSDLMLTITGPQGYGKSTLLKLLCINDDYFTDAWHYGMDSKDEVDIFRGKMIAENPEGSNASKRDGIDLKAKISKTNSRVRLSYDHRALTREHRFMLATTSNEKRIVNEDSAGRRWIFVEAHKRISNDLKWLRNECKLVIGEAVYRLLEAIDNGMTATEACAIPEDMWSASINVQEDHIQENPFADRIFELIGVYDRIGADVSGCLANKQFISNVSKIRTDEGELVKAEINNPNIIDIRLRTSDILNYFGIKLEQHGRYNKILSGAIKNNPVLRAGECGNKSDIYWSNKPFKYFGNKVNGYQLNITDNGCAQAFWRKKDEILKIIDAKPMF